jgi:Ca2+-transporting ATPase
MQAMTDRHWHHLSEHEVLDLLDTRVDHGLEPFEVKARQTKFGPNALTPHESQGPLIRFLLQFNQPLVYILIVAAIITMSMGEWVDASVIGFVVLVNAVIGYIQETRAVKAIAALAQVMLSEATVLRAGKKQSVSSPQLVPGDIIFLHSGDKVPADVRLLSTRELQVDESTLTGESLPVHKQKHILAHNTILADRTNMAYSGTLVTYGMGIGVVTATGDNTEIGHISELISSAQVLETPLTRKITQFSKILLYIILAMALLTFIIGILRGEPWQQMFMAAVALAVGAIPEGLPAAVTIMLAIGVARMAKRNAIIRKLPAVETLGSTTVICSDKTGTLTQNQMTVQKISTGNKLFNVSGIGYVPEGKFSLMGIDPSANYKEPSADKKPSAEYIEIKVSEHKALTHILRAGVLCNDARLVLVENDWIIEGDPTEGALLVSAAKAGITTEALAHQFTELDTIPFESKYQYMASLFEQHNEAPAETQSTKIVYIKGSVEALLPACQNRLSNSGRIYPLDTERIEHTVEQLVSDGLRVLAFAFVRLPAETDSITHQDITYGLTFLGLQGMIDPPRDEVSQSVKICQTAGIKVKMITGDHAGTAISIAKQIGIHPPEGKALQISGPEINELSDEQLINRAEDLTVFARVAPEQKLRLVKALQVRHHIVAMTGDGVNDAPALRRADIGIAMGMTGTEVSKEAADMILTDDNFSTIQSAIEEGRGVFDNLIKFITWTLPTNLGEGLVIMTAVIAGVVLPVLPVQILWVNMTTAIFLGLMLAFEPKEAGIMPRPPRDPQSPIISGILTCRIFLVGFLLLTGTFGLFQLALSEGLSITEARTIAVNMFVFGELFYLFNCRSLTNSMFSLGFFSNPWLLGGVTVMSLLQLFYTYSPLMNSWFHSAPLDATAWMRIMLVGFAIYLIVGIEKWFWFQNRHQSKKFSVIQKPGKAK